MIPAAVPHPRLTLAHRFTRDKQIWVGRAVGFLQCADGAMSFGLRDCIAWRYSRSVFHRAFH
ncbi:MAG: hypothetical protein ACPGVQ_08080, partial [Paracoccaceae bacterium]